jgi:hypothetical protein
MVPSPHHLSSSANVNPTIKPSFIPSLAMEISDEMVAVIGYNANCNHSQASPLVAVNWQMVSCAGNQQPTLYRCILSHDIGRMLRTRSKSNGLAIHHINHSATISCKGPKVGYIQSKQILSSNVVSVFILMPLNSLYIFHRHTSQSIVVLTLCRTNFA